MHLEDCWKRVDGGTRTPTPTGFERGPGAKRPSADETRLNFGAKVFDHEKGRHIFSSSPAWQIASLGRCIHIWAAHHRLSNKRMGPHSCCFLRLVGDGGWGSRDSVRLSTALVHFPNLNVNLNGISRRRRFEVYGLLFVTLGRLCPVLSPPIYRSVCVVFVDEFRFWVR